MRLLIVDDEKRTVEALEMVIDWKSCGIDQIRKAYSADEAREILTGEHIDLLFTDIEMPGDNGIALLEWTHAHCPSVVYTVLTGYSDFAYVRSALQLGSVDYLLKPVHPEELLNVTEKMIHLVNGHEDDKRIRMYANQYLKSLKADMERSREGMTNEELAEEINSYIYQHLLEELTVRQIADHFYMSSDHINRLYKKQTGTTINQYIIRERMNLAARLLEETDYSATDIAMHVGYSSYPSFVNMFVKIHGVSPSVYAEAHRKK